MFYLPRICEHCLNPSCVASCPSGAMYKRSEDGIVLVDQDRCRGWRMCVSGCPYKKVYFNHRTGKAEKCTLCYPRIEVGQPTVCSETCVGRLRYLGLFLYDADKVLAAASVENDQDLYEAQLDLLLDPNDPAVIEQARRDGIADDWIEAAQRSPVYALAKKYRLALPLHPEYRTMPMVWYIPPLSPVVDALANTGHDAEDKGNLFAAIEAMRIPIGYLANLLTAGDVSVVDGVLRRLAAMRAYMRDINLGRDADESIAESVGLTGEDVYEMYRLLAIAKYDQRYVIPAAHREAAEALEESPGCSLDFQGGPGMQGSPVDRSGPVPVSIESFHLTKQRAEAEAYAALPEAGGER
jgi:nitrate reductase beta subunit